MKVITTIIFDLRDFRNISEYDSIAVPVGTIVRFELQNSLKDEFIYPIRSDIEFFVDFRRSPFENRVDTFKTKIYGSDEDSKFIGEGLVNKPGEYKFSIGIKNSDKWDIEIDPILIVYRSLIPPYNLI